MSRLRDLPPSRLDDLPGPCRTCVFWETAKGRRGPTNDVHVAAGKDAWWQATQLEWGVPAKAVYRDDELVGYALFAPSSYFLRTRRLHAAASDDALLLAVLWVAEGHRGGGVGRMLLQAVLREAHRHHVKAVEAFGARGIEALGSCVLPEAFLLANGFSVASEDAGFPLLRLELRQTVRESVGQAVERVLSVLGRRERVPARPALEARHRP